MVAPRRWVPPARRRPFRPPARRVLPSVAPDFPSWTPWTSQSPGVGSGTPSAGSDTIAANTYCHSTYIPFTGQSVPTDEYTRLKKCVDDTDYGGWIKTKTAGTPVSIPSQVWNVAGDCVYLGTSTQTSEPSPVINWWLFTAYSQCSDCEPGCYILVDCAGSASAKYTNQDLSAHVGKVVTLSGTGTTCWQVAQTFPCAAPTTVTVASSKASCAACAPDCCTCGTGGTACKHDEDNALLVVNIQQCTCPLDFYGTLMSITGSIPLTSCATGTPEVSTFEGPVQVVKEFWQTTTCGGTPFGSPEHFTETFTAKISCGDSATWTWEITAGGNPPSISYQRSGNCDGWTHSASCFPSEEVVVSGNTNCE